MINKNLKGFYPEKEITLAVLEGKWKLTLLCHLGLQGTKRFGELKQLTPGITQQMLTNQLKELEETGLVHREVYRVVPPKVEYSLTAEGESLLPILDMLYEWGSNHPVHADAEQSMYAEKLRTLSVIEGKWKLIILCHVGLKGTKRFGELRKLIPSITKKMLAAQLREMEEDGLMHREVYPVVPPKVEYSLTDQGMSLFPILTALEEWGSRYIARHGEV
ncbi:transcriptional regulator [Salimicrobium jeotgali]|uniref:HTH-type transcriptional activator HxlR n=1 Tax=Salimicrobium jeotgali TaxID=1230341 RepID=K2GB86_9BACI|nr:transcriptional regulator [Salimicrobium jeotgali]EKE32328.1 HTH-type transcriptional activator HxlR [Salimicrobium jeotgali]MBM7695699.1 DNA-binding HxlR family transcriptional regulator [Salimicrobium jeotgali]